MSFNRRGLFACLLQSHYFIHLFYSIIFFPLLLLRFIVIHSSHSVPVKFWLVFSESLPLSLSLCVQFFLFLFLSMRVILFPFSPYLFFFLHHLWTSAAIILFWIYDIKSFVCVCVFFLCFFSLLIKSVVGYQMRPLKQKTIDWFSFFSRSSCMPNNADYNKRNSIKNPWIFNDIENNNPSEFMNAKERKKHGKYIARQLEMWFFKSESLYEFYISSHISVVVVVVREKPHNHTAPKPCSIRKVFIKYIHIFRTDFGYIGKTVKTKKVIKKYIRVVKC